MKVYTPPDKYSLDNKYTIFLGGSIEMDKAEQWQKKLIESLKEFDINILNPRRDQFDVTQEQSVKNPYFKGQVNWEIDGLENAHLIVMYLQPDTLAPISLFEIGLMVNILNIHRRMIICCPQGYWRKGNIEVIVDRFNEYCILTDTFDDFETKIKEFIIADNKLHPKITLEEYLKDKEPYDLNFDKVLKDNEGEELDFENWNINSIEGDILKISHGGDWQEPKQAHYQWDGKDKFTLIGSDKPNFKRVKV